MAIAGAVTGSSLLQALAYTGFLLNLFNLLPVVPLDGGRAMAAMAPSMWFFGFAALVVLFFLAPNAILLIIILFGGLETWRRWKQRKSRTLESAAYYRVSPRNRMLVGAVYVGLIVALSSAWRPPTSSTRSASGPLLAAADLAQRPLDLALGVALLDRLPLVVDVLASGQGDLDLRAATREVDPRRYERQPPLGHPRLDPIDLRRLSSSLRSRSGSWFSRLAGRVRRDVDVAQPQLPVLQRREPVLQLGPAVRSDLTSVPWSTRPHSTRSSRL